MELYNGKYCISHAELTDGIMSVANVQWYNKQNKLDVARSLGVDAAGCTVVDTYLLVSLSSRSSIVLY